MQMTKDRRIWKFAANFARFTKALNRKFSEKKKSIVPNVTLNNGHRMPILGFGTWQSEPGIVAQAIKEAIDVGYRHIDCAHVYENECEVGDGITAKIDEGVVKRANLFITSKLWNIYHRPDLVRGACETTLNALKTPYLDLYLIHWPMAFKEGKELFPKDKNNKTAYSNADYVDTWKEMEKLVDHGLCKSIGISNFNSKQVQRVLKVACIPPAVNQVECHPYLNQKKLMKFCKSKNIAITAYSPLGAPKRPFTKPDDPIVMDDPDITCIAEKHEKTVAQILIRYQIQRGNIVIPKSVNKNRIASNFNVFDFELCKEDMEILDNLNRNIRLVDFPDEGICPPHYPFSEEF